MKHKWFIPGLALAALASATPALTLIKAPPISPDSVIESEESVREILDEYGEAYATYRKAYNDAPDRAAKGKVRSELQPNSGKFAERLIAAAKADPTGADTMEGLKWVVRSGRNSQASADAWSIAVKHYLQDSGMEAFCGSVVRAEASAESMDRLRLVLDESPHRNVQGMATYALAMQCKNFAEAHPEDAQQSKRLLAEYATLLEEVQADYADVKYGRGTLGTTAAGALFKYNNLSIGKVAPDIEGDDIDGVSFKLSDYRGKVVVLDFWGNW